MKLGDVWTYKNGPGAYCLVGATSTFLIAQSVMVGKNVEALSSQPTIIDPEYLHKHFSHHSRLSFKNFLRVKHG
jgi:hypothetical protein